MSADIVIPSHLSELAPRRLRIPVVGVVEHLSSPMIQRIEPTAPARLRADRHRMMQTHLLAPTLGCRLRFAATAISWRRHRPHRGLCRIRRSASLVGSVLVAIRLSRPAVVRPGDAQVKRAAAVDRARRTAHVELVPWAGAGTTRMMAHPPGDHRGTGVPPVSPGEVRNRFRQALTDRSPGDSNSAEALCPWGIQSVSQQRTRSTGRHREQPHRPTATKPSTTTAGGTASRSQAGPPGGTSNPAGSEIVGAASGGACGVTGPEVTGPVSNMPTCRAPPCRARVCEREF